MCPIHETTGLEYIMYLECDVGFLVEEEENSHLMGGDLEDVSLHLQHCHSGVCSLHTSQGR